MTAAAAEDPKAQAQPQPQTKTQVAGSHEAAIITKRALCELIPAVDIRGNAEPPGDTSGPGHAGAKIKLANEE